MAYISNTETCFHTWKVQDTREFVDAYSCDTFYKLSCVNCGQSKEVDEYEYKKLIVIHRKGYAK